MIPSALGLDALQYSVAIPAYWIPGRLFWPYFAGFAVIGAWAFVAFRIAPRLAPQTQLGALLFAIPMAIFGAQHFTVSQAVATVVPSWIPWHLFWVYLVGAALLAAAFSFVTRIRISLAALMLALMLFLFVCLIHVPSCFATPYDRTRLTVLLRDLALSAGALVLGASTSEWPEEWRWAVVDVGRYLIAIPILIFGVQHFLHPEAAPGIPQQNPTTYLSIPSWIPAHAALAYVTGAVFVFCGMGMMLSKRARISATFTGLTLLALTLFVYLPRVIAAPRDIGFGLNYLAIHSALAGAVLLLASALPERVLVDVLADEREPAGLQHASKS